MKAAYPALVSVLANCGGLAAPAAPASVLPFREYDGLVVLETRVGDNPLRQSFLLDTGASPCVLDRAEAAQLGLSTAEPTRERVGGAGRFRAPTVTRRIRLQTGAITTECAETIVVDLHDVSKALGVALAGIIGGDFFVDRVVRVSYDSATIGVFPAHGGAGVAADADRICIRLRDKRPYLDAILSVADGPQNVTRELLIDLGSQDRVDDPMLLEAKGRQKSVTTSGLGTGGHGVEGEFSEVRIGSQRFQHLRGTAGNVSLVGTGILKRYNVVFAYSQGWIALEYRRERH